MAHSEHEHHCHHGEEVDWTNSKLYRCKQSFKERFIAEINLRKEHRLMDVGCAEGEFLNELSSKVQSIVGVDIDTDAIEKANKANAASNVTYETADFGTKLGDDQKEKWRGAFDVIMSGFTLHFVADVQRFAQNLHLCLKPGGVLHLTYMGDKRGWTARTATFLRNHPKWGKYVKDSQSRNNIMESGSDAVKEIFVTNGFSDMQIEEHDLATDDYSDEDAQGYVYGVLGMSFSIPDEHSAEYLADVCKFSRDSFCTNSPWEYIRLIARK